MYVQNTRARSKYPQRKTPAAFCWRLCGHNRSQYFTEAPGVSDTFPFLVLSVTGKFHYDADNEAEAGLSAE